MKIMKSGLLMALLAGWANAQNVAPPPDADAAEAALKNSPRHGEFIFIDLPGGDKMKTWVVYPERADKAPVILVIHEIFGMTDWANSVADHLASQGFIAVAPDMVYGVEGDGNTMTIVRNLPNDERVRRLNAAREYGMKLPAANGKVGSIGFCWGGSTSFLYAVSQPDLDAAVVCYGGSPDTTLLKNAKAPILGLYAGDDARVNTTIPPAEKELDRLDKSFDHEIYAGAGHGFFRQQKGRDGANMTAATKGWERAVTFFREHLEERP
jgi:carboxymethylenebutenolidase